MLFSSRTTSFFFCAIFASYILSLYTASFSSSLQSAALARILRPGPSYAGCLPRLFRAIRTYLQLPADCSGLHCDNDVTVYRLCANDTHRHNTCEQRSRHALQSDWIAYLSDTVQDQGAFSLPLLQCIYLGKTSVLCTKHGVTQALCPSRNKRRASAVDFAKVPT